MNKTMFQNENSKLQLLTESELPKGKRLVFVDEAVSLEEFFAGTYIPFNSEFLVAQTSPGSRGRGVVDASLTEVYHVHPTLPLQIFRIGNWSSVAGLSWSSVPLVRRRGDLHGTLIKGALRPQVPRVHFIQCNVCACALACLLPRCADCHKLEGKFFALFVGLSRCLRINM